jgi:1-acyl-sn-glycerol-3-phosphate acyltransferase
VLIGLLGPAMDLYSRRGVTGVERLDEVAPPVLFVANHSSHMDTPAILRALPRKWRRRTAVAAATDYFYSNRALARAVSLLFNTVPVQRNGGGLGPQSTSHLDRLIERRWNLLLFPEGTRSRDGTVARLRSGAAVLAVEHGSPIVPIFLRGTRAVMPPGRPWMRRKLWRRHHIEIRFGAPIRAGDGEEPIEVMERVREFFADSGAPTTPDADALKPPVSA